MTTVSEKIKVAIIIPCYNSQKTIKKTLESVLLQTFKSFTVYIINDGSTDDTVNVINSLRKEYCNEVRIITQHNQGQAAARNRGIQESKEPYIAFIDSDDLWHPEKLYYQIKYLESHLKIGLCYTKALTIDELGNQIGVINISLSYRGKCFQHLVLSNNIVASSVLVRRSVIKQIGLFDTKLSACENWDLWLRISQAFSIDYLDNALTYYRIHTDNISRNSTKMYENRKKVLEKHLLGLHSKDELKTVKTKAFHKHHKLYGLKLVEELKLAEARREFIKAIDYNKLDVQSYKILLKTLLGKKVFLAIRKLKGFVSSSS